MALSDVSLGDPHVDAHNLERHSINALLDLVNTGRLSVDDLLTQFVPNFGAYLPESYGAVGDNTTDDTVAVQQCIAACRPGGTIFLSRKYFIPGGVTVDHQIRIEGGGALYQGTSWQSGFSTNSTSVSPITVTAHGCTFRDFAIMNSSTTPTAGAGLDVTYAEFTTVDNLAIVGFYNGLQTNNGSYYNITNSKILDFVNYGLYIRNGLFTDNGDMAVSGCVIGGYSKNRTPAAAVRYESGGGLKFFGNKINGSVASSGGSHNSIGIGLDVEIADGVSTSVLVVTGNSIEGWNTAGILATQKGPGNTGGLGKIVVVGNEIAGNSGTAIAVQPVATANWRELVINSNSIGNCASSITVRYVDTVSIGQNTHKSVTGGIVTFLTGVVNSSVAPQIVSGDNIVLFNSASENTGSSGVAYGQARYEFSRELLANTSSSTYIGLYRISVPQYAGGKASVTLSGNVHGVGGFVYTSTILFTRATGAVTATVQGADGTSGALIDITWDTSTVSGEFRIGYKLHASTGTDIDGRAVLIVDGNVSNVKKGI